MYMNEYKGEIGQWRNATRWQDPADPKQQIDPNHAQAYWGVIYAVAGGLPKEVFNCPSAGHGERGDATFVAGAIYTSYSQNCYGGQYSGFTEEKRAAKFGSKDEIALFVRKNGKWLGRKMTRMQHETRTIFAQEGYESVLDGNGDTFVVDPVLGSRWYQWTPPRHPVDLSHEYLRHNKAANVLFADTHVERLRREDMADERLYTGRW